MLRVIAAQTDWEADRRLLESIRSFALQPVLMTNQKMSHCKSFTKILRIFSAEIYCHHRQIIRTIYMTGKAIYSEDYISLIIVSWLISNFRFQLANGAFELFWQPSRLRRFKSQVPKPDHRCVLGHYG